MVFAPFHRHLGGCAIRRFFVRVKSGENTLEIRVTNPWKNRICGDKLAKAGETTYTWTSYPWSKKTKNILMPAGLLGPVTITLYK